MALTSDDSAPLRDVELAVIAARVDAATPGPWRADMREHRQRRARTNR